MADVNKNLVSHRRFSLVDKPNMDVFGSTNTKKTIDCTCPNCKRTVASIIFASHLEKCMGKTKKKLLLFPFVSLFQ